MTKMNLAMRIALAIAAGIASFAIAATALAATDAPQLDRAARDGSAIAEISAYHGRKHQVCCDRGQSLAKALRTARSGDRFRVSGTCNESVRITIDNLHLSGSQGAAIDGASKPSEAVLTIDGARNVSVRGLSIQNGSDQGILIMRQSLVALTDLSLSGNGTVGLSIDRSHVDIHDLAMDNNGTGGMDAYTSSTVVATGKISASGNGGDGLAVNGKTFFELRGATVTASQNVGSGVSVINDARLQIFSFPEAQGSTITADNNGFAGIGLLGAELGVVGSQYFGSGANIISASGNVFGFFIPAGAILSPHATARFVASNNFMGMLMEDGASALIIGGLSLSQNVTGLSAIGAGTVTLVSVPPNPANVTANGLDLDLGFGTRITLDGVAADSISCDSTVLLRGSLACP